MDKQELIDFEKEVVMLWEAAKIPYPIHFSGGNEEKQRHLSGLQKAAYDRGNEQGG